MMTQMALPEAPASTACSRCGGTGVYRWGHDQSGDCFKCNGTGTFVLRTLPSRSSDSVSSPFTGRTIDLGAEPVRPSTFEMPHGDGFYTVILPGRHATLRIAPWSNRPGKHVISCLVGPDNGSDYVGFASFDEEDRTVTVWNRFRTGHERWIETVQRLGALTPEELSDSRMGYAMRSGRCARCGRRLTVPASIFRGLGPDCFELV